MQIDINADVAEGIDNEAYLMPYLSSCNVACGGHAGDLQTMTKVVKLAKTHNVKIGAHPSFPDRVNFGRLDMKISVADLYSSLKQQIRALQNVLHSENAMLHHIKPHGALYNLAAKDEKTAKIIVEVIKTIAMPVKLYAPYKSVIAEIAKTQHIEVMYEAFADRNYNEDLSLVSRQSENAVLTKKEAVAKHVLQIIKLQKIKTINGVEVPIKATTICMHGDTENVIESLKYLTQKLHENNIIIR
jgi:UPF0271 protein